MKKKKVMMRVMTKVMIKMMVIVIQKLTAGKPPMVS
jgi:hypothetical protein